MFNIEFTMEQSYKIGKNAIDSIGDSVKNVKSGICKMSSVMCGMSNADVDPWDMLNNFCFDVYTQK